MKLLVQLQNTHHRKLIVDLLDFSIAVGTACAQLSPNLPKIPFLLIEDLLECQTLTQGALIWEIVESMVDVLTQPELFNRGEHLNQSRTLTCLSLKENLSC
jgi:hypothetical protein